MNSLTVHIDKNLKKQVQEKIKKDGSSLTFVITQALKAYNDDKLRFGLISKDDDEITASFEVSTKKGKRECLKSFSSLMK